MRSPADGRRHHTFVFALWVCIWLAAWPAPLAATIAEEIRAQVAVLEANRPLVIDGEKLQARRSLAKLYASNGFRPYWDAARLQALIEVLKDIEDDGLTPADYHLAPLQRLMTSARSDVDRARLDLLASDAFALALYHLYFGKVDPVSLDPHWNFDSREIRETEAVRFVHDALRNNRIHGSIELVRPKHWMYAAGRDALAAHRAIAALGGWPKIPAGPALRIGSMDSRVPTLRRRLAISGDLAAVGGSSRSGADEDATLFDATLEAALRHAQRRHRLTVDGVLGKSTLQALNVPVEARIAQLRVNLERGRQVLHEIREGNLVVVDIAGFEVHYVRDSERIWRSRAVVGQAYRETPVFKARIESLVFNPSWTVPPGILQKDILPSLRRGDRSILARKKLKVQDATGRELDPARIDFSRYRASNFPFTLRQDPGPDNALGVIKIDFPNPHLVYLHDTPVKSLFEETARTFSSGCIRIERALELAELLLADPQHWNRTALDAAIATGETRTLRLVDPVPVLLIYWTADRDDDGSIVFKQDPYRRDARELAALDEPFRIGRRPPL